MKDSRKSILLGDIPYSLFSLFVILITLLFLFISLYNHPSADDFCYSRHSIFMGFWPAQSFFYLNWSGRYLATVLLTVYPIELTSLTFYRLLPLLLFLSFGASIYCFLKKLLPGTDAKDRNLLALIIFFLYIFKAPTISEAFYWMPGSITYQLAAIITLFLLTVILHVKEQHSNISKIFYTFLAGVLCLAVVGLNETSLIILNVILVLWFLIDTYLYKRVDPFLISLVVITITASAFSIFSPGNTVRMAVKPDKFKPWFSISFSIKYALYAILRWAPMTLLLILVWVRPLTRIGESLRQRLSINKITLFHIFLFGGFLLCFIFLCYFPSLWTQGGPPPDRTVNVIFLLYIFGIFALASAILVYLKNTKLEKILFSIPVRISACALGLALILLTTNNVRTVFKDLVTGTAVRYDAEMEERYALLRNCAEETCVVPLINHTPNTILAYDIATKTKSEEYYYNECLSDYFEKPFIMGHYEEPSEE